VHRPSPISTEQRASRAANSCATPRASSAWAKPRIVSAPPRKNKRSGYVFELSSVEPACRQCGKDLLVAFSCKKRSVCPSCNARRMCGTVAHLVDRVFPSVPVRQWVLSVPFELRLLLAKGHRALSAVGRILVREVFHWQWEQAVLRGITRARYGAVCSPGVHETGGFSARLPLWGSPAPHRTHPRTRGRAEHPPEAGPSRSHPSAPPDLEN
jgi:hypothetical protein